MPDSPSHTAQINQSAPTGHLSDYPTRQRVDDAEHDHQRPDDLLVNDEPTNVISPTADQDDWLRGGDVLLDRSAYRVMAGERFLTLSLREFRLLALLMEHADHVVPARIILQELWGAEYHGHSNTVAVHMLRLRKKLESHPGATHHLRTVRNIGYIFDTVPMRA